MKISITIKPASQVSPYGMELNFELVVDGPVPFPINGLSIKLRRSFDLQRICLRKFLYHELEIIRNGSILMTVDEIDWIFSSDYIGFLRYAEHFIEAIGKE